jgi:four helix bundle protein
MAFIFENLQIYQQAVDFADAVCELSGGFPRGYYFLQDQLNRAALSIATNLAEGNGRFTNADRRHFFSIARGSLQECVPLLEVARRRNLIPDDRHEQLRASLEEMARMLAGLINGLDRRQTP